MARINNKINLPTNTTDITMLYHYLKKISEKGVIQVEQEQEIFKQVKLEKSRKDTVDPSKDTHTKKTLDTFGLISIDSTDKSFQVSSLGKELIDLFGKEKQSEEERSALMLKIFLAWKQIDDRFSRNIHPGFLIIQLLCDSDLDFYITNHELSFFSMIKSFKTDDQYNEIKDAILKFRKRNYPISEFIDQTKSDIFLATFVNNWRILLKDELKTINKLENEQIDEIKTEWENDRLIIDFNKTTENTDNDHDEDQTVNINHSTKFTINRYRLDPISFYIAKLYISFTKHIDIDAYISRDYFKEQISPADKTPENSVVQKIFYGAPGTGKSFTINELINKENANYIRTTFHPDTDYSTFVGSYKPTNVEVPLMTVMGTQAVAVKNTDGTPHMETKIVYDFVSQSFLKAYVNAWKLYANGIETGNIETEYLIIEEINRGNCAQIFGDLFQLLDRNNEGFSDYPIEADADMEKQLRKKFNGVKISSHDNINAMYANTGRDIVEEVLTGKILLLPKNLFIWATMNTSDQSLFPIDSAFKRRWDWIYMPITNANKNWTISVNHNSYDWWEFLKRINELIWNTTYSEDKKLGYFFCKAQKKIISAERFVGKVMFYLWNDVFKDYGFENEIFKDTDEGGKLTFNKFYITTNQNHTIIDENKVEMFLKNLGLKPTNEHDNLDKNDVES